MQNMKEKENLSIRNPRLPGRLPEAQRSAHSALGRCHPLHPLEDFFAFRNLSGNCHHHCAGWQMSPNERVERTTHYKAFLGPDQEEEERAKEGWQRIWFSPGAGDIVSSEPGWGEGDGKGLPLGQEIGNHFLSPALPTVQGAPGTVPGEQVLLHDHVFESMIEETEFLNILKKMLGIG